jgi:hypothetical protein
MTRTAHHHDRKNVSIRRVGRPGRRREHGAALVEFALILPIFMMLVLGMLSGGLAYNRKISITGGAREGARYGATLPVNSDMATWLYTVAKSVRDGASGDLNDGVSGRRICVAYVYPNGVADVNDRTSSVVINSGTFPASGAAISVSNTPCTLSDNTTVYDDGITDPAQRRVNVVGSASSKIEVMLFSFTKTLESKSSTRFEAVPAS